MKFFLFIFAILISLTFGAAATNYDSHTISKLKELGVYFGDPTENIIIGSGDMFVIIHNPTELSITVMKQGAKEFCKNKSANQIYSSDYMKLLGRYTAYFSCMLTNKISHFDLPQEEQDCITGIFKTMNCRELNKKNTKIIENIQSQIENEEKYKSVDFIYLIRKSYFEEIEKYEKASELKRKSNLLELNLEMCKSYNFKPNTEAYYKCLLNLLAK